jgi:hypothetical protein
MSNSLSCRSLAEGAVCWASNVHGLQQRAKPICCKPELGSTLQFGEHRQQGRDMPHSHVPGVVNEVPDTEPHSFQL